MWNAGRTATWFISVVWHAVKHTAAVSLVIVWALCQQAYAQQGKVNLQRKITIQADQMRFDSLLHFITRQSGVTFAVNTRKYPPSRVMRLQKGSQSLRDLLDAIHRKSGIFYTVKGDHVIFIDHPPGQLNIVRKSPPASASVAALKQPVTTFKKKSPRYLASRPGSLQSNQVMQTNISLKKIPIAAPAPTPISALLEHPHLISPLKTDTDTMTAAYATGKRYNDTLTRVAIKGTDTLSISNSGNLSPRTSFWESISIPRLFSLSGNRVQKEGHRSSLFRPVIKTGISADETFYVNPTIQGGLPFLYGIISWSTNFNSSGFRYGVGVSAQIADDWRLHLDLTTGKLEKSYSIDTIGGNLKGKSTLTSLGFKVEKQLNSKWSVLAGITYRWLHTAYYSNDILAPPPISEAAVKSHLNPINPFYTITNSYSANGARQKQTWIGLQVGICYHINFSRRR